MTNRPNDKPTRFYKEANVVQLEDGYAIQLDGRPVRTPLGQAQLLMSKALAEAIADEWRSQGDKVDPASMPLCGYANTAIDRIGNNRQIIFDDVLNFASTDLLCYRSEAPDDLVARQNEQWQPLLDWSAETMGGELQVTVGVLPVKQPVKAIEALANKLQQLDDMELAGIASLTAACGSLILALALAEGRIDADHAFDFAQLDEIYQNERWGADEESKVRQKNLKKDIVSAALFLSLLRS
jgi:chaperone required for assembly of F1-ATPase